MNGAQDLGGQMGFGPIELEDNEPNFHAKWEERAFAITLAMGATGSWNIDTSRHAREKLPSPIYLSTSYYEIWTRGLEQLLSGQGIDHFGRAEDRTCPAARTARQTGSRGRKRCSCACQRRARRPTSDRPGPLQDRRQNSHKAHASGGAYPSAALCPRYHRRD